MSRFVRTQVLFRAPYRLLIVPLLLQLFYPFPASLDRGNVEAFTRHIQFREEELVKCHRQYRVLTAYADAYSLESTQVFGRRQF